MEHYNVDLVFDTDHNSLNDCSTQVVTTSIMFEADIDRFMNQQTLIMETFYLDLEKILEEAELSKRYYRDWWGL